MRTLTNQDKLYRGYLWICLLHKPKNNKNRKQY